MPFSTASISLAEMRLSDANDDDAVSPSGVQSMAVIGTIKDARPIRTYADAPRALIIRMG